MAPLQVLVIPSNMQKAVVDVMELQETGRADRSELSYPRKIVGKIIDT